MSRFFIEHFCFETATLYPQCRTCQKTRIQRMGSYSFVPEVSSPFGLHGFNLKRTPFNPLILSDQSWPPPFFYESRLVGLNSVDFAFYYVIPHSFIFTNRIQTYPFFRVLWNFLWCTFVVHRCAICEISVPWEKVTPPFYCNNLLLLQYFSSRSYLLDCAVPIPLWLACADPLAYGLALFPVWAFIPSNLTSLFSCYS